MCEDNSRNCSSDCLRPMPASLLWLILVMMPSHSTLPFSRRFGVLRILTHLILPFCAITTRPSQFQNDKASAEVRMACWKEARSLG